MPDHDALQALALEALMDLIAQRKVSAGDLLKVLGLSLASEQPAAPLRFDIQVLEDR